MWDELNQWLHGPRGPEHRPSEDLRESQESDIENEAGEPGWGEPLGVENDPRRFPEADEGELENGPPVAEEDGPNASTAETGDGAGAPDACAVDLPFLAPGLAGRRPGGPRARGRRLAKPEAAKGPNYTPAQRLLVLDCWQRSGLPAKDFAPLVGVSKHTLYSWKKAFTEHGPAGLMEQRRGAKTGSRLPELTRRTILMLKQEHPEWGCERISAMLLRGPALAASPSAVARVLHEEGYELQEAPTRPHPDKVRFFERAKPNQLWQTDLFTFVLKRQNRRVYLVAFLDDHSRYIVSFGLHTNPSSTWVRDVLAAGIASYGAPQEVLTDNGPQYVTWRGESVFQKDLKQRGIRQIVSRPRHPQTLGKIERFWGTLWRECLETAVFTDFPDARQRIALFIDGYNFRRPHSGVDGLTPADRFFGAAPDVLRTLKERVAANALELARNGIPRPPFYLTGQMAGQNFSLHAEGERVYLTRAGAERQEVDMAPPSGINPVVLPEAVCPDCSASNVPTDLDDAHLPGTSPLDALWPAGAETDPQTPEAGAAENGGGE